MADKTLFNIIRKESSFEAELTNNFTMSRCFV